MMTTYDFPCDTVTSSTTKAYIVGVSPSTGAEKAVPFASVSLPSSTRHATVVMPEKLKTPFTST